MDLKPLLQKTTASVKNKYHQVNDLTGGVLGIIRRTFERFAEERGFEAAASLAYYAFFSLFPMLLVFIVIGSFFIEPDLVIEQLLDLLKGILPGVEEVIIENINQVLELRGAVTFIALISLVWSATSVFNILAKNINRAFQHASMPSFVKSRMLGFFMFMGLGLLMLISFAVSTLSRFVSSSNLMLNGKMLDETFLWQIGAFLVPVGLNLLMFWAMYEWVPMVTVSNKASSISALCAGVAWQFLNNAFALYLGSGLSQYRLIYGSVGAVVALLFWIYLTATLFLLGAHLTAAIQKAKFEKTDAPQL